MSDAPKLKESSRDFADRVLALVNLRGDLARDEVRQMVVAHDADIISFTMLALGDLSEEDE